MKKIGVDLDCYDLARSFILDERTRREMNNAAAARYTKSLAEHIKSAIEDWFAAQNWEPR